MDDPVPTFEVQDVGGRPLMVCTIDGETGAARIFSKGEDDAKMRAEQDARRKIANRSDKP